MEHDTHHEGQHSPASAILAVLIVTFAPCALTLAWVIHLASGGR